MGTMLMDVVNGVLNAMSAVVYEGWSVLLPLAVAVLLLLAGSFLAHWVRYVVDYVLSELKLDDVCETGGINPLMQRLGLGRSPTRVAGFLAYWGVMLAFLLPAADVAQLGVVRDYLRAVVAFVPQLVAAVLIMGGGLILGHFLGGIARNAAAANHLEEAEFIGWATYWAMAVFSGLMAFQRLGVDTSVLMGHPFLAVGALCLGGLFLFVNHHKGLGLPLFKHVTPPKPHHMVKTKA